MLCVHILLFFTSVYLSLSFEMRFSPSRLLRSKDFYSELLKGAQHTHLTYSSEHTDIWYSRSTSILGAKYVLLCSRKTKNKQNQNSIPIYCQLTEAVRCHDKVPNWPSIVFLSLFSHPVDFFEAFVWLLFFCENIFFCWKYRYREMILYIVIYKCVQKRKYINGFSQWGSMHELFLKKQAGKGGGHCIRHCTFPKSNQIILVHF